MNIREWRRQRASRRADRRALRAERRAEGRGTSPDIQSDKGWGQTYGSGGYFSKNQPPRP